MTASNDIEIDEDNKPVTGTSNKLLQLPLARIRTIMRSSPDLPNVSSETYFLIARATELFVQYMATETYKSLDNKKVLDYKSLATLVENDESLEFLEEIVPQKIKMADYWKRIGYESHSTEVSSTNSKKSPVKNKPSESVVETIVIDDD